MSAYYTFYLATKNQNPKAYLINEEWLDIGRIEEYNLAHELYSEIFSWERLYFLWGQLAAATLMFCAH